MKQKIIDLEIIKEWDYEKNTFNPEEITFGSNKKVWWICSKNKEHKWEAKISTRIRKNSQCPYCANRKIDKTNNIFITHPHLEKEWDYEKNLLNPLQVSEGMSKKVWWICSKNKEHKWEGRINTRTRGQDCPYCCNRKVNHTNNITVSHPYLLEEWDYEKNQINPEEITFGSSKKVFWICSKNSDHKWKTNINLRTRPNQPTGCPFCSNRQIDHTNCLSTSHPYLLEEWDYEKNQIIPNTITQGSGKKVYWICSKNKEHKWISSVNSRTNMKSGCPFCKTVISKGHQEVVDYIKTFYNKTIEINDRKQIRPKEIDIFLPDLQIAFEYNGSYWHSFEQIKKNDEKKKNLCKNKNIKLFSIEENDWLHKNELCKSQIKKEIMSIYIRNE